MIRKNDPRKPEELLSSAVLLCPIYFSHVDGTWVKPQSENTQINFLSDTVKDTKSGFCG